MKEEERILEFENFVKDKIPKEGINWLIKNGFFTAPASTKYHLNYEGGLFEHSMNTAKSLLELTKNQNLQWKRPESPYIVGLLHDVCKIDQYKYDKKNNSYVWNDEQEVLGHGDKSVKYCNDYIIKLNEEEEYCILNHMGAFTTDKEKWSEFTDGIHKYQNVLWTHVADMMASHIIERKNEK